jgi:hypothetical protein
MSSLNPGALVVVVEEPSRGRRGGVCGGVGWGGGGKTNARTGTKRRREYNTPALPAAGTPNNTSGRRGSGTGSSGCGGFTGQGDAGRGTEMSGEIRDGSRSKEARTNAKGRFRVRELSKIPSGRVALENFIVPFLTLRL